MDDISDADDMPAEYNLSQMKNGVRGKYYARMQEGVEINAMQSMEERYPNIAEWVRGGARIELGHDDHTPVLARAIDEGGVAWEGESEYPTLDAMLDALEAGIAAWNEENA